VDHIFVIRSNWSIYEYVEDGKSTIYKWLIDQDIPDNDRGHLVAKMDMLAQNGTDLWPGILAGPIKSKAHPKKLKPSHIYKLIVHGQRMLRPMLCRGPVDMNTEFTFLTGAIEKGGVLDVDAMNAEDRRQEVIADPENKRRLNGRYKRDVKS
jgi:hypothetical protein